MKEISPNNNNIINNNIDFRNEALAAYFSGVFKKILCRNFLFFYGFFMTERKIVNFF